MTILRVQQHSLRHTEGRQRTCNGDIIDVAIESCESDRPRVRPRPARLSRRIVRCTDHIHYAETSITGNHIYPVALSDVPGKPRRRDIAWGTRVVTMLVRESDIVCAAEKGALLSSGDVTPHWRAGIGRIEKRRIACHIGHITILADEGYTPFVANASIVRREGLTSDVDTVIERANDTCQGR